MNFAMWKKALRVIPAVSKQEWESLDFVSRWLISTRAAVLIMTFISSALAGLFAVRDGHFALLPWLALTLGLILAHATNNLFNDYTDFVKGVDKDNYFRTLYGPQPVASGLMTTNQLLAYAAGTGLIALAFGLYLIFTNDNDPLLWLFLGLGVFFVLFYTWPLKYMALGEIAVLLVWGPLMIGGGYYVLSGIWDWNIAWATIPYYFGVTTVIFGKHIDKIQMDAEKRIYTLPVLLGEKISRYTVVAMMVLPYLLVLGMIGARYFTPVMLLTLLALPTLRRILPNFLKPRPASRPEGFPDGQGGWPLFFAPLAFANNRAFGGLFMLGLLLDVALRILFPQFWR